VRFVPAGCATPPEYSLTANLYDANNIETVEARWFVNYDASQRTYYIPAQSDPIPPDPDPLVLTRVVPPNAETGDPQPFLFRPYDHPPANGMPPAVGPPYVEAGVVRVVELVVSNGFDPTALEWPESSLPRRAVLPGFETQVYRWVFVTVAENAGTCSPGQAGCVKCP
jgi:hypothetical protein